MMNGVNPDTRIHCLDTMGHNWWSVCVCGLGDCCWQWMKYAKQI